MQKDFEILIINDDYRGDFDLSIFDRILDEHFDGPRVHRNRPIQPNPRSFRKGS